MNVDVFEKKILLIGALFLLLAACGDSGNGGTTQSLANGVDTFDDLPNCSANRDGDTVSVAEESVTYICLDGKWGVLKHMIDSVKTEDDLSACSKTFEGDSAYVTSEYAVYVCRENVWMKAESVVKTYRSSDDMPNCTKKLTGVEAVSTTESMLFLCDGERWKEMATTYGSAKDLPNCTDNREGNQAFLKETNEKFLCSAKRWISIDEWSDDISSRLEHQESSASNSSGSAGEENSSGSEKEMCGEKEYNPAVSFCDFRDFQVYKFVVIGRQVWMAENLNYESENSYCYGKNFINCSTYGRLYSWSAAMDACPEGWHLPDSTEWETLIAEVGGENIAGAKLKSTVGWSNTGNGTKGSGSDDFGFSVLPAGQFSPYCYVSYGDCPLGYNCGYSRDEEFSSMGMSAFFWSSTLAERGDYAGSVNMSPDDVAGYYAGGGSVGECGDTYSVRCLKNKKIFEDVSSSSKNETYSSASVVVDPSEVVRGTWTDKRDGQVYRTVTIGNQTWMAQNLNYETANSYCYDDDETNCSTYGRLYTWSAAVKACPEGWELPSLGIWEKLFVAVGGQGEGTKLKSNSGWDSNGDGTDDYGFAVLPAGSRMSNGNYHSKGFYTLFWSSEVQYSSVSYSAAAVSVYMDATHGIATPHVGGMDDDINTDGMSNAWSVRCFWVGLLMTNK